jgi:hypothetical protein
MTPTFGELVAAAELHLSGAHRYPLVTLDEGELVQMAAAARTCVDAVVRLADSTTREDRPVLDPDPCWHEFLQGFWAELDRARVRADALPRASGELAYPATAQRLTCAATAVGAAVDLLATHFDVHADGVGDRDDLAAYIDSIEGRRAIATQSACLAALLSPITRDISLALHAHFGRRTGALAHALLDVSEHLATAAKLSQTPGAAGHERTALTAIPVTQRIRREGMPPTQDVRVLLDYAIGCAERLHQMAFLDAGTTPGPTIDPPALTITASAFASTQAMTARCHRHLSGHAEQIAPDLTAGRVSRDMRNSADVAESAYQHWLDVRDGLRGARD